MEHRMEPARTGRGFTLIELLTVIAIIAVLAALLFPIFGTVREQARQSNTLSNMHAIYLGARLFADDEGRFPSSLFGYAMTPVPGAVPPAFRPAKPGDPVVPMDQATEVFQTPGGVNHGYLYGDQVKDYNSFLNSDNIAGGSLINDKSATTEVFYPLNSPYSIARGGTAANRILVTWEADALNPEDNCSWYGDQDLPDATYAASDANGKRVLNVPKVFYKMDSMDIGPIVDSYGKPVLDGAGNQMYELHYSPNWTHELYRPVTANNPVPCDVDTAASPISNQLKYKLPPGDRTVITYSTHHAAGAGSPSIIVLLDDGTARKIQAERAYNQLPLGYTP